MAHILPLKVQLLARRLSGRGERGGHGGRGAKISGRGGGGSNRGGGRGKKSPATQAAEKVKLAAFLLNKHGAGGSKLGSNVHNLLT